MTESLSFDEHQQKYCLHNCSGILPYSGYGEAIDHCYEDLDGSLHAGNDEYCSQVNFCPYCGYKSKVPNNPMTDWIKVIDSLPNINTIVLAYDTNKIYICYREDREDYNEHWIICEDQTCACTGCTGAITHWMELPKSPNNPMSENIYENMD